MTTATHELAAAMGAMNITAEVTEGPEVRTVDGWQHRHYRFRLSIAGEHLGHYPYSAGMGHTSPPDATDLFGAILADCQSIEPYANDDADEARNVYPQTRSAWPPRWDEWADDLGMLQPHAEITRDGFPKHTGRANLRKLADDFREIMSRRALLRDRLGADRYAALLAIAAEL